MKQATQTKRKRSVVAIWLDSADRATIEDLMAQGLLPCLQELRNKGAYGRLQNVDRMLSETSYSTLMTGCSSEVTKYWTRLYYDPKSCSVRNIGRYDFREIPPFYALGDLNVCVFDVPKAALRDELRGLQVLGWGANAPLDLGCSLPGELLGELEMRHGKWDGCDYAELGDSQALVRLSEILHEGLRRRECITKDLLQRDDWDLFFTTFSEVHAGTHTIFPHPELDTRDGFPSLRELHVNIYQRVDAALREVLEEVDEDATIVVFSVEGMTNNKRDIPSLVFLPEVLFRYSFPGQVALEFNHGPSPESLAGIVNWVMEIWNQRKRTNKFSSRLRQKLDKPKMVSVERQLGVEPSLFQPESFDVCNYQPPIWYSPYWPYMKAFALPTFSDGHVRINVCGRDKGGVVEPSEYDQVCTEITEILHDLKDPQNGSAIVSKVVRTLQRVEPFDQKGPSADLIVYWADGVRNSAVSTLFGKLGPVPYFMAGSHNPDGFVIVAGPDVPPGTTLSDGFALDIAPTILEALDVPIPKYMEGKPLLSFSTHSRLIGSQA